MSLRAWRSSGPARVMPSLRKLLTSWSLLACEMYYRLTQVPCGWSHLRLYLRPTECGVWGSHGSAGQTRAELSAERCNRRASKEYCALRVFMLHLATVKQPWCWRRSGLSCWMHCMGGFSAVMSRLHVGRSLREAVQLAAGRSML